MEPNTDAPNDFPYNRSSVGWSAIFIHIYWTHFSVCALCMVAHSFVQCNVMWWVWLLEATQNKRVQVLRATTQESAWASEILYGNNNRIAVVYYIRFDHTGTHNIHKHIVRIHIGIPSGEYGLLFSCVRLFIAMLWCCCCCRRPLPHSFHKKWERWEWHIF